MRGRHKRPEFSVDKLVKVAELLTQLALLANAVRHLI